MIATLKHEIAGLIEVQPEGGKEARAHAVSPQIESGNIYLPHPALYPWVLEYVAEWNSFPRGAHDDQVDATTQALHRLSMQDEVNILLFFNADTGEYQEEPWPAPNSYF